MCASGVRFLQPNEVKCLLEDPQMSPNMVILDVRDDDFAGGHIRGCVNLPCWELLQGDNLDTFIRSTCVDGTRMIVVHCYLSQQRGPLTARRLSERLSQLEKNTIQVCVLAHGYRRFSSLYPEWIEK